MEYNLFEKQVITSFVDHLAKLYLTGPARRIKRSTIRTPYLQNRYIFFAAYTRAHYSYSFLNFFQTGTNATKFLFFIN